MTVEAAPQANAKAAEDKAKDGKQSEKKKIAPAKPRSSVELLSRRIMRVTIPANVKTVTGHDLHKTEMQYVDVHVATPYGVTQHLHIPVMPKAAQAKPADSEEGEAPAPTEEQVRMIAEEAANAVVAEAKTASEAAKSLATEAREAAGQAATKAAGVAEEVKQVRTRTIELANETRKLIENATPARFRWHSVPRNLTAEISYDEKGKVAGFGFGVETSQTSLKLTQSGGAPDVLSPRKDAQGKAAQAAQAELAFWIRLKGTSDATHKVAAGPFKVRIDEPIKLGNFQEAVRKAIADRTAEFGLGTVELHGFVRFPNDDLPVLRLENVISVSVSTPNPEDQVSD